MLSADLTAAGLRRGAAKYGNSAVPTAVQYAAKSVEYDAVQAEVYQLATAMVIPRLRDYARGVRKWAIVLDVDGTVLNDATYDEDMWEKGGKFDAADHTRWLAEPGNVRAIPGAKEFLDAVRAVSAEQGGCGKVVYVTNCEAGTDVITANLSRAGLFVGGDELVRTGPALSKGVARKQIEDAGYVIEATIGDSLRDHFEVYGQDALGRGKALLDEAIRDGRAFVTVNAMYGQWETEKAYNSGGAR